jgi:hypothetical protein
VSRLPGFVTARGAGLAAIGVGCLAALSFVGGLAVDDERFMRAARPLAIIALMLAITSGVRFKSGRLR